MNASTTAREAAALWVWAEERTGPLRPDTVAAWTVLLDELDDTTSAAHAVVHDSIAAALTGPRGSVTPPPAEVGTAATLHGFAALPAAFWFITQDLAGPLSRDTAPAWSNHLAALATRQRAALTALRAVVADAAIPAHREPLP